MEMLRYEIDDRGDLGVTLMEFKTLKEMDVFMKQFHDSNDVRKYFKEKINKYLKTAEAKKFFDTPAKDGRERNGSIICYHEYKYHKMKKICCLYDNEIISESLYTRLRESLNDPSTLKELYDRKYFLLPSQFSKDELRRAVIKNGSPRAFIDDLVRYVHNLDQEEQYVYLRSICDICNLLVYPKKKPIIVLKVVNTSVIEGITEYSLVNVGKCKCTIEKKEEHIDEFQYEVSLDAPEYFKKIFYEAVKKKDFELLFNEFTHEEIDLYSNFYKKGKGK